MEVIVDGCVFENNWQLGIWRYFYETLSRIGTRAGVTLWLRRDPLQPLPPDTSVVRDHGRYYGPRFDPVHRIRRFFSRFGPPPACVRRATVFHSSFFTICPLRGLVSVVTVHDMIAERLAHVSQGWALEAQRKRKVILSAAICICISQATADDLINFYPQVKNRVRVIHHGSEHSINPPGQRLEEKTRVDKQLDYALFVGGRRGYKNFPVVLDAMTSPTWPTALSLHVVGLPLCTDEQSAIRDRNLSQRIHYSGQLSDSDLHEEYRHANCFIFSSLMEGFGLPVVEAQANGTPVVCSDIPAFREVAGRAALFFDPQEPERLAAAVTAVQEPIARSGLIQSGYANIGRFSWDRAAEQTLAVYQEATELAKIRGEQGRSRRRLLKENVRGTLCQTICTKGRDDCPPVAER